MQLALETHGLRRTFGEFAAVDGIDLAVPRGCLYGFLGPNGAGKSTTIKCLTGLLRPSAGTIRILGICPEADPIGVRRQVGVVPEDLALFDRLTAAETLAFIAARPRDHLPPTGRSPRALTAHAYTAPHGQAPVTRSAPGTPLVIRVPYVPAPHAWRPRSRYQNAPRATGSVPSDAGGASMPPCRQVSPAPAPTGNWPTRPRAAS